MSREVVAYQGAPGAFGEIAARTLGAVELLPCRDFSAVLAALRSGTATQAVLPIENSSIGTISPVARLLAEVAAGPRDLRRVGELVVPVQHCLIRPAGSPAAPLRHVASHPAALAQCTKFFARHPYLAAVPDFDTAGALDQLAGRPGVAVIASARAAQLRSATVLLHHLEDDPENATRFLIFTLGA